MMKVGDNQGADKAAELRIDTASVRSSERRARALFTAKQMVVLLEERPIGPLHERAIGAAEAAAGVLWGDKWEVRVEDASRALTGAAIKREHLGAQPRAVVEDELHTYQRLEAVPPHVDMPTWTKAVDIWIARRARRRGLGGKWDALALIFDMDADSLRQMARKPSDRRKA